MTREELSKKAKPILFNTEMVQAILDGRKTVTRRVIKLDLGLADTDKNDSSYLRIPDEYGDYHDAKDLCRYKIGDILYVRETWSPVWVRPRRYLYRASPEDIPENTPIKWHPSIHMPKKAARIFLKVTDVRVERLRDITEEQARKEGCITYGDKVENEKFKNVLDFDLTAKDAFIDLWNSIIKKQDLDQYGWDANPWVWVIEFERIQDY